MKYFKTIKATY